MSQASSLANPSALLEKAALCEVVLGRQRQASKVSLLTSMPRRGGRESFKGQKGLELCNGTAEG